MRAGLAAGHGTLDVTLRGIAEARDAQYISAIDAFCTSDGCLALASADLGDLVSYDQSHLTPSGSRVLTEAAFQVGVLSAAQLP